MYKGAPFPFICDAPTQSRTASTLLSQSVLKKKKSRSSSRSHDAVCLFFLFNIFHYFLIRLKTVPTNGFIRLSNIHRFVWSVWSEPDVLPYAFDTSEAWVFCRGCQIRNPLEDSTDKRFYSLVEYTPFRLVGMERTRRFALRFRYFGSVGILSRLSNP